MNKNNADGLHIEVKQVNNSSISEQPVYMEEGERRILDSFNGIIPVNNFAPEIFDENGNGLWIVRELYSEPFSEELESKPKPAPIDWSDIESLLEYKDCYKEKLTYWKKTEIINDVGACYFMYNIIRRACAKIYGNRLAYHKAKFTNKVNEKMIEVFGRFDKAKANGEGIDNMVDQTRNQIIALARTINKFFTNEDGHLDEFEMVDSDYKEAIKLINEKEEFLRYAAIHMCQFWLELNSRYDIQERNLSEEIGCFYADFLPDIQNFGGYDIVPAPDYPKPAAKLAEARNDFGLCLHAGIYYKALLDSLIAELLSLKLILPEEENTVREFLSTGRCEGVIHWQGSYGIFVHFIKRIMKITTQKYGQLVTLPQGAKNIWKDVVSRRFVDKDGKSYGHEKLRKAPNSCKDVTTALVKIFQDYAREIDQLV